MSATEQDPDFQPFDFVYAGRRAMVGNKAGGMIHRVVEGRLAEGELFDAKTFKSMAIGGVYRGAVFAESRARGLAGARFVERWKDSARCIDWRARDEAYEADKRHDKLQADARKINEIEAMLLPLRKLYATYRQKYDHAGQEALEQAVLRALRANPRKSEVD